MRGSLSLASQTQLMGQVHFKTFVIEVSDRQYWGGDLCKHSLLQLGKAAI